MQITLEIKKNTFDIDLSDNLLKESRLVAKFYTLFLRHIRIKGLNRITVEFEGRLERPYILPPIKDVMVCQVSWPILIDELIGETKEEFRYRILSEELSKALIATFLANKWPSDEILQAKNSIIASNYNPRFDLLNVKNSPNRKIKVKVVLEPTKHSNNIVLEISPNGLEKREVNIFEMTTNEYDYSILANKIGWKDNSILNLTGLNGEVVFEINIETLEVVKTIIPIKNTKEYIEDELFILDANSPNDAVLQILKKRLPASLRDRF